MAKSIVTGTSKIKTRLYELEKKLAAPKNLKVTVGYKAPYAVYVHEILHYHHPIGQAKYLEVPMLLYQNEMFQIAYKEVKNGNGITVGAIKAAEFLKEKALELTPIDTGYLRSSAFIKLE